jgi:hypothetical protein
VLLQAGYQGFEGDAAAWAGAQVFVHGDPGFQGKRDLPLEYSHQRIAAPGDGYLTSTDTGAGPDQSELREIAVRPHGKFLAAQNGQGFPGAADESGLLVEADECVMR